MMKLLRRVFSASDTALPATSAPQGATTTQPPFSAVPNIIGQPQPLGSLVESSVGIVEEFWRDANDGKLNNEEATIIWSHRIHDAATSMLTLSKELKYLAYPELRPAGQTMAADPYLIMQNGIRAAIRGQRESYPHFSYAHGVPYQSLDIAIVFGVRESEVRYENYELGDLLKPSDRILDIGASCGFMSILAAYRNGCRADCVEHNSYMTDIGAAVADYLRVKNKVRFIAKRFQDWLPDYRYTVIFSFAAHWTDDEGLRPDFRSHMERLHDLLEAGGHVVFESHSMDIGNPEFQRKMDGIRDLFNWSGSKLLDHNRRELFILTRRPA